MLQLVQLGPGKSFAAGAGISCATAVGLRVINPFVPLSMLLLACAQPVCSVLVTFALRERLTLRYAIVGALTGYLALWVVFFAVAAFFAPHL
jgi:hypothetical protein